MTTQSGTIDGIAYASSSYVHDPQGDGIVTDILYYDQAGHQVADRTVFGWPPFTVGPKTVNADGSFSVMITPPPGDDGVNEGYVLESFSSSGLWQREDVYSPVFTDPNNLHGGISGYTETSYTLANVLGPGSSGSINGAYYDRVLMTYTPGGRLIETDYQYDLNGSSVEVARQYYPNPVLTVPPAGTATAGTPLALNYISMTDPWADSHAGTIALTISVDAGTVTGTDSAGHSFSATAGSAARLTGTLSQINADLANLSFTDQTAGTAHLTFIVYDQAGVSTSKQDLITVSSPTTAPNPVVSGPATLTIPADTLLHGLNAAFSDPWSANHAGSLALNATTTLGTLTDVADGHSTTGTSLHLAGTYSQIEADVSGLALTSNQAGTGTVRIEVYDQAGVEATHLIGVTAQASA